MPSYTDRTQNMQHFSNNKEVRPQKPTFWRRWSYTLHRVASRPLATYRNRNSSIARRCYRLSIRSSVKLCCSLPGFAGELEPAEPIVEDESTRMLRFLFKL